MSDFLDVGARTEFEEGDAVSNELARLRDRIDTLERLMTRGTLPSPLRWVMVNGSGGYRSVAIENEVTGESLTVFSG